MYMTVREREREREKGMSQCVVPSWNNLKHNHHHHPNRQDLISQAEERNRFSQIVPMSNYEVTELTWENGQLAMHELGGMLPPPPQPPSSTSSSPPKPAWGGVIGQVADTLESIVHQANYINPPPNPTLMPAPTQTMKKVGSYVSSSSGKWAENLGPGQGQGQGQNPPAPPGMVKKRTRSESDHAMMMANNDLESGCASGNAAFCRDNNNNNNNDTTMMTWASYESPRSCTRTKTTTDEDSAYHGGSENHEEERETKGETGRSYTARKGRAAAVHNQSERRRRDRINQKMKALQKLVPNASKTDKASMLDEVIEYLKQLQAQVQMMTNARLMPQLMMPALGMQQHLQQMSLLARMGMNTGLGLGMGMLDSSNMGPTSTPSQHIPQLIHPTQVPTPTSGFVPPGAFLVPQMMTRTQQPNTDPGASSSSPLQDPYSAALLAQSMNLDLYNRIAALQRQQQQQTQTPNQTRSNPMHLNHHVQGG